MFFVLFAGLFLACGSPEKPLGIEIVKTAQQKEKKGDDSTKTIEVGTMKKALHSCSGYWGRYIFATTAGHRFSWQGKRNYWSPNCFMDAPGGDCGPGNDDNMVSFWLGPDFTWDRYQYRRTSTSYWGRVWLMARGGGVSTRVYVNHINGRWHGNAYTCVPKWVDPGSIRLIRIR